MKTLLNKNRNDFLEEFPKNIICAEIGVFQGEFSEYILRHIQPKKFHLIDMWRIGGKTWASISTELIYQNVNKKFEKEIASKQVIINEANDTIFLRTFPDNYFDWVYLDSSHNYVHTKEELAILKDKVKDDGIIAGHDWIPNKNHNHHGVFKAIHEFMEEHNYEIVCIDNHLQWAIRKV